MKCHRSSMMENDTAQVHAHNCAQIRHAMHRSNPQGLVCSPQLLHSLMPGVICIEAPL